MLSPIRRSVFPFALLLTLGGCAGMQADGDALDALPAEAADVTPGVTAGERALDEDRYGEASKAFQRVLRQEPEHARAKLGLAEAFLGLGAHTEAQALFEELRDLPEMRVRATQGIAIARLAGGETEAARGMLTELTAEDPSLWRAWNALARSHDLDEQWEDAAEAYERALETSPRPAQIHNNMGMSLMAQERYEAAGEQFAAALERDPSLEIADTNLRLVLAYQDRYAEALAGVERDRLPMALNNVGYVALVRGDLPRAEAYFLRALEASASFYRPAARNLELLGSMKQIQAGDADS